MASTTPGALLPTFTTAMPAPKSMNELPSTSTMTPPPALAANTGIVLPIFAGRAAARRAASSRERGPGISVTMRRTCSMSDMLALLGKAPCGHVLTTVGVPAAAPNPAGREPAALVALPPSPG